MSPNPVIYDASAGLTPISPTIDVTHVVEIPVFASMTKFPAVPRFTGAGPAASATFVPIRLIKREREHRQTFVINFHIFY